MKFLKCSVANAPFVAQTRDPALRARRCLIHFGVLPFVLTLGVRAGAQATNVAAADSVQCGDSTGFTVPSRRQPVSTAHYQPEPFLRFAIRTVGPLALLRSTALAGVDQFRRQPIHWTQNSRGFRDRLDAHLGGEIIGHTIEFAVRRAARQEPEKFRPCDCSGLEPRLTHALLTPFRVGTPEGERYSVILPTSAVVSALTVTSVHPGGFSLSRGLEGGAGGVASAALTSVVREFWPWRWRPPGL